jgi:cytochrome c oxidase subunit 2
MNFPFIPEQASTYAVKVDAIVFALTALTVLFTVLVLGFLAFLAIRYRRGSNVDRSHPVHTHHYLELAWSLPPLFLGLGVFVWAVGPYADVYNPPPGAEEIFVIGKRWMWHIQHVNGIRENNELHVPVDKDFKLTLISQDVIHGFYVPDFRVKRDVMPGKYNTCWFHATKTGKFHLFCTEYCGTNHSQMGGWVYVMTPVEYAAWVKTGGTSGLTATSTVQTPEQEGADLFNQLACGNCHKTEDSIRGPSLEGLYGRPRKLQSGQTVTADDNYLRAVIRKPEDNLLAGYGPLMPAYTPDQISEEQVHSLIAYIKSLGVAAAPQPKPSNPSAANPKPTPSQPNGIRTTTPNSKPTPPSAAKRPQAPKSSTGKQP